MTVRELMARLINCDMNKQVIIELTEEDEKLLFSNRVIFFGRNFCKAKSPICDSCKIKNFCCIS